MTLQDAIAYAKAADVAFDECLRQHGYKSRWDWNQRNDLRPMPAYIVKVWADEAMGDAFAQSRKQ